MSVCLERIIDMSNEHNRINSYATIEKEFPVFKLRLAKAGFFYTGTGSIVKCFCCKRKIYELNRGDNTIEKHRIISPNCEFIKSSAFSIVNNENRQSNTNGLFCKIEQNVLSFNNDTRSSIQAKYQMYADIGRRLESLIPWSYNDIQFSEYLAEAGFFYTGSGDEVRCFLCGIGISNRKMEDDPWVEHVRQSPGCTYVNKVRGREFIVTIQVELRKFRRPRHPGFDNYYLRLNSFSRLSVDHSQSLIMLAAAGFFYAGEGDEVRCYYCDGGLRLWAMSDSDDPWVEHARWFPYCKQ